MRRFTFILVALGVGVFWHGHPADAACGKSTNAIRVITRDASATLLPGMNVSFYHKSFDPDGNPYFGSGVIAQSQTDAGGQTPILCLPASAAPYAVKIYQKNPAFGYFTYWDIYEGGPLDLSKVEVNLSGFQVIFRDAQGTLLKNVVFDIYLQSFDVDGEPVVDVTKLNADKLVASDFNTQVFGVTRAFLTPGHYVFRVHGTGNSYFYLWNQEVNTEEETPLEYHLGTMRFVFEDGFGNAVKNQSFTIYRQISDVRGVAIYGDPVASGLSTGPTGKFDAYLPAGTYAMRISGTGGTQYRSYGWRIAEEEYKPVTYRMSGIRLMLRAPTGELARTTKYSIATQRRDALGKPIVDKYLVKGQTTGEPGFVDLYVPAGTYLLVVGTQRLSQIDVFDRQFTSVDWPRTITFRYSSESSVITPVSNSNFTVRKITVRTLPSYLGDIARVGSVYQYRADRLRGSYQVTLTASAARLDDLGVSARSLRIAFYSPARKRWTFAGKVNTAKRQVTATFKEFGYAVLVARY